MPNTPHGLPYPAPTDRPDGAAQIQALAEAVDSALTPLKANWTTTGASVVLTTDAQGIVEIPTGLWAVRGCTAMSGDRGAFAGYFAHESATSGTSIRLRALTPGGANHIGAVMRINWVAFGN
jgi:hypothetical protein